MSENDAQLELKKRARRRLVGATALALLAAIVLPMVMDQAPRQPVQDIQIRIPAQDAGTFTSRILPVKPETATTPLPPAAVPETKSAETEPPAGAQWVVQLGAYRDQANVRNLTAKIEQQGYNFYTEPAPDGSSKTRVRAGPFTSKEAAEAARERIKRIGVDGVVAQK